MAAHKNSNDRRRSRSAAHLRIIQINDVYQLDNFPSFRSLVDQYSEEPDKTIVVLAGDFVSPSLLSSLDRGRGMVDVMGEAGVTHVCLGNHEADIPPSALADRIRESKFSWINTNMRALDEALMVETQTHDIFQVSSSDGSQTRSVALLGLLTEDMSLYKPDAFHGAIQGIEPVLDSARKWAPQLQSDGVDLIVPMTHQDRELDASLAEEIGGDSFPIVIGGHDHDISDETVNGCRIIKCGQDAFHAGIIDFVWDSSSSDRPIVSVEMVEVQSFPSDLRVQKCVENHKRVLAELETARLFAINKAMKVVPGATVPHEGFTTRLNRYGTTSGSTVLASFLRRAMNSELALINAGGIRGNKTYADEWFTYADLKSEFPFDDPVVSLPIEGSILESAIAYSRKGSKQNPPKEESAFLHTCENVIFDESGDHIRSICGVTFDPDRQYFTAIPISLLNGLDNIQPLVQWVKKRSISVQEDVAKPIKIALVELFALNFWLLLGEINWGKDSNKRGCLCEYAIQSRFRSVYGEEVSNIMMKDVLAVADLRSTGCINLNGVLVAQLSAHLKNEPYRPERRVTHILENMAATHLGPSADQSTIQKAVNNAKKLAEQVEVL